MKRAISGLLTILACTPGAIADPAVKLQLSLGSGSKLHYTHQGTVILKKDGKRTSQIDSHQVTFHIDHCNLSSCVYSVTIDGTRLKVETTIAHDGTILTVDSANESPYNMGYAMGALAKRFSMFHGVELKPGQAKTCGAKWGSEVNLSSALKSVLNELMTASCMLIKTEKGGRSEHLVIKYEQAISDRFGSIDVKSQGQITFDRTTGVLIKDEERIIGDNLPTQIEALEFSGTTQLDSQRSMIKELPSTLREHQGHRP